jgi:hypothetical protein
MSRWKNDLETPTESFLPLVKGRRRPKGFKEILGGSTKEIVSIVELSDSVKRGEKKKKRRSGRWGGDVYRTQLGKAPATMRGWLK